MVNIDFISTLLIPKAQTGYQNQDRRCDIYARINEEASGARVTVCSGEARHRHIYTTTSNSVEIQIIKAADSADDSAYFVIAFRGTVC